MLSIHTNAASFAAQNTLVRTEGRLATSMTRLGTGWRINSATDDATGLQIATRLAAQSSGMAAAMSNIQKSLSILQSADGALDGSSNILLRMKALATQAADGASTATDRQALQAEFGALSDQLSNISSGTSFGGSKLLFGDTATERATVAAETASALANEASSNAALAGANGDYGLALANDVAGSTPATRTALLVAGAAVADLTVQAGAAQTASAAAQKYAAAVAKVTAVDGMFSRETHFQIGATGSEVMAFNLTPLLNSMHSALHAASTTYDTFGIQSDTSGTDLLLASGAGAAIDRLQQAIDAVARVRAAMGASANSLEYAHNNLATMHIHTKEASGRIKDADFAQESADMISSQMLMQAGVAMLQQSHSIAPMLLALLR